MSAAASEDAHAPPLDNDDASDTSAIAVAQDAQLAAEAEALARRRATALAHKCRTLGDAEEMCVQFVCDVVDDMFMEMQVVEETQRSFALVAQCATHEVFRSLTMGAMEANVSLDRVVQTASHQSLRWSTGTMQQVLKPASASTDSDGTSPSLQRTSTSRRISPHLCECTARLRFLQQLSTRLETHTSAAHTAFLQFPTTAYVLPQQAPPQHHHHHPHHRHQQQHASTNKGSGTWALPAHDLSAFLMQFIATTHLCVLPSAVAYIATVSSAGALEKKHKTPGTLTLAQVQVCVQKALFAAEEALRTEQETSTSKSIGASIGATGATVATPSTRDATELERTQHQQRVFQTEVLQCFSTRSSSSSSATARAAPAALRDSSVATEVDDDDDLPLVCYLDESGPVPSRIDRNAPSSLARKPAAASAQGLARKVVRTLMMQSGPAKDSKWLALRTRVLVRDSQTTEVAVVADMSVNVSGDSKKKQIALGQTQSALSAETGSTVAGAGDKKPPLSVEPDTAALSNIFSLGTPRQMNAEELARRSDILTLLEREELRHERRMANASVAAMAMPPVAALSETDKVYQAYVAGNSSITVSLIQATAAAPGAPASAALSPTRPLEKAKPASLHQARELALRTKFDLEREPPAFVVSDGNAHVRDELHALELALCSPIKRSKARGTRPAMPNGAPMSPDKAMAESSTSSLMADSHRSIQTASSHLPQLETSRLAVGVRAVVRGVEKRGPKRSPSRKSRLKLHNYSSELESAAVAESIDDDEQLHDTPPSPIKRPPAGALESSLQQQQHNGPSPAAPSRFLPLIPPVSPIKASPHRKHVRYHSDATSTSPTRQHHTEAAADASSPLVRDHHGADTESLLAAAGRRSLPAKQPVWDTKTASPPRVRNRFFASGAATKARKFHHHHPFGFQRRDGDGASAAFATHDGDDDDDNGLNLFKPALEAPRRSHLPVSDRE